MDIFVDEVAPRLPLPAIAIVGIGESNTGPLKVAVIVTVLPFLYGEPPDPEYVIAAVGEVLSTVTVAPEVGAAVTVFPAASVPTLNANVSVPSP